MPPYGGRKLRISRKLPHDWIKAKARGPEGLNRKRGPKPGPRRLKPLQAEANKRSALVKANERTAELERLVGRLAPRPSFTLSAIPQAYQSNAVRHRPNCSRETIANRAARMRCDLETGMKRTAIRVEAISTCLE